jgi:hypothetical protein
MLLRDTVVIRYRESIGSCKNNREKIPGPDPILNCAAAVRAFLPPGAKTSSREVKESS